MARQFAGKKQNKTKKKKTPHLAQVTQKMTIYRNNNFIFIINSTKYVQHPNPFGRHEY